MKRFWAFLCILCLLMGFAACGEKNNSEDIGSSDTNNIEEEYDELTVVVISCFDFFQKGDYESMKTYCTQECIDTYFHDGDVFGMIWAKATSFSMELENPNENECRILVNVDMETTKTSALYGESETSFYVVLRKEYGDSWLINSFITG